MDAPHTLIEKGLRLVEGKATYIGRVEYWPMAKPNYRITVTSESTRKRSVLTEHDDVLIAMDEWRNLVLRTPELMGDLPC